MSAGDAPNSVVEEPLNTKIKVEAPIKIENVSEEDEQLVDEDKPEFNCGKTIDPGDSSKGIARGVKGTVKWFSRYNRYGFIHRNDIDEDIYVHVSGVVQRTSACHILKADQEVEFDVVDGFKGAKAIGVTLVGGYLIEDTPTVPFINKRVRDKRNSNKKEVKKEEVGDKKKRTRRRQKRTVNEDKKESDPGAKIKKEII